MTPTTEQEARAREASATAHRLLGGECQDIDGRRVFIHSTTCLAVAARLLAEHSKLDAANARADEARAAALREAEEIARRRGHAYTRATVLTVHNVVEVAARAACIEVADEIAAFIPTPPTSAATTGRETP